MKYLVIIEVSQKQNYIFSSNALAENVRRSKKIAYVTSSKFFKSFAGSLYDEDKNLINAGGGHTVLQFDDKETAKKFVWTVTNTAMKVFPGMEIFAKTMEVKDEDLKAKLPGDLFFELTKQLEIKKAERKASFYRTSFGIEKIDTYTRLPEPLSAYEDLKAIAEKDITEMFSASDEKRFSLDSRAWTSEIDRIAGNSYNFIAVVHADGNNMGAKVQKIYESHTEWNDCCTALKNFSKNIQDKYERAFMQMVQAVKEEYDKCPIRPIILAGDDISFITRGDLGIICTKILLEKIAEKSVNNDKLSACAGVAIVHKKYPVHAASDLAEELCSSAKKFGASIDAVGRVSAMDWHIDFGQLKDLSEIREDYIADDGSVMTLRPVTVVIPKDIENMTKEIPDEIRTIQFFEKMINKLHEAEKSSDKEKNIPRSKIKGLREQITLGKEETEFYIEDSAILYQMDQISAERYKKIKGKEYSVLFDAIELMDDYKFDTVKKQENENGAKNNAQN